MREKFCIQERRLRYKREKFGISKRIGWDVRESEVLDVRERRLGFKREKVGI